MRIRGATYGDRVAARTKRTAARRAAYYVSRMDTAGDVHHQIRFVCDYLRAVAGDLPKEQARAMATEIAAVVERWNPR